MTARMVSTERALRMQIAALETEIRHHFDSVHAIHDKLDPLRARLKILELRDVDPDDLVARARELLRRNWELDVHPDDERFDGLELSKVRRELENVIEDLKRLGRSKDAEELDNAISSPPIELRARNERARWLHDLAQWPPVFRRKLAPLIDELCAPDRVEDDHWGAVLIEERRIGWSLGRYPQRWEDDLPRCLRDLRRAREDLRSELHARKRTWRSRAAKAQRRLETARIDVLFCLWSWNHRRIEAADRENGRAA